MSILSIFRPGKSPYRRFAEWLLGMSIKNLVFAFVIWVCSLIFLPAFNIDSLGYPQVLALLVTFDALMIFVIVTKESGELV